MADTMTPDKKILRGKIQLQYSYPMFAYVLGYTHISEDKTGTCPTMGIDRYANIVYNAEFVDKMSDKEVQGVLVHEILHYILQHHLRLACNPLNNVAEDIAVNDIIGGMKDLALPDACIRPENHEYTLGKYTIKDIQTKSVERIADELRKNLPKQKGKLPEFDQHRFKGEEDALGPKRGGCKDTEEERERWENIAVRAATLGKMQGNMPAGLQQLIDQFLLPKVNWKQKLKRFIRSQIVSRRSWDRPSRKSFALGYYLPRTVKENIEIIVHADTSGSTWPIVGEFVSELYHILRAYHQVKVDFLASDCGKPRHWELKRSDSEILKDLPIPGGGGTSHIPVVEWIKENRPNAQACVFFTDGYSDIEQAFKDLPASCRRIGVFPIAYTDQAEALRPFFNDISLIEES